MLGVGRRAAVARAHAVKYLVPSAVPPVVHLSARRGSWAPATRERRQKQAGDLSRHPRCWFVCGMTFTVKRHMLGGDRPSVAVPIRPGTRLCLEDMRLSRVPAARMRTQPRTQPASTCPPDAARALLSSSTPSLPQSAPPMARPGGHTPRTRGDPPSRESSDISIPSIGQLRRPSKLPIQVRAICAVIQVRASCALVCIYMYVCAGAYRCMRVRTNASVVYAYTYLAVYAMRPPRAPTCPARGWIWCTCGWMWCAAWWLGDVCVGYCGVCVSGLTDLHVQLSCVCLRRRGCPHAYARVYVATGAHRHLATRT
jgi:hypothetical protein